MRCRGSPQAVCNMSAHIENGKQRLQRVNATHGGHPRYVQLRPRWNQVTASDISDLIFTLRFTIEGNCVLHEPGSPTVLHPRRESDAMRGSCSPEYKFVFLETGKKQPCSMAQQQPSYNAPCFVICEAGA